MDLISILEELRDITEEFLTLVEGEIIDFQKKRKEKVLDRNAYKMADILRSGKLKVTKTGQLMGDPEAMKQVKDIEKENKEVGLGRKVGLN
jgi:molybdopterin biosynthesis enzyme